MPLEDYREQIFKSCIGCGSCREGYGSFMPVCPSGERFGFDSYYAIGRVKIGRGLLTGTIDWSDALLDRLYTCTQCGACDDLCYPQMLMKPLDIIREIEREFVKRGIVHPEHKKLVDNTLKYHNPFGKTATTQPGMDIKPGTEILFYAGCQNVWNDPEIMKNKTVELLQSAGIDFGMLQDEWCCGNPLIATGHIEEAKDLVKHNVETIEKLNVKKVIFNCPTCYMTFRDFYPDILGRKLPFEIVHRVEYLEELIDSKKLNPSKEVRKKVTYHDPCTLGRMSNIYDSPRNVLGSIPGLELVEMPRNRECAWCCGSGGAVEFGYPDFANWAASERLEEAGNTGAELLTTVCPMCEKAFLTALGSGKRSIGICDISELLADALE
jgi:Fe-S oxidoreductase